MFKLIKAAKSTTRINNDAREVWDAYRRTCEEKGYAKGKTLLLILRDWVTKQK
jgi:hypothetical protein